ncbi:hypothetical protein BDD12DRAFT_807027 [Trichophaea hybrida]|nr:hypothetical protein BDD12DRAFT_807027 [Trichophaea hybrida]
MGVCASCLESCLGVRRKEDSEHTPLLNDTPQNTYATYTGYPPSPTVAPQQLLHEREYLDRLVAQTSENLIDIFAPPMLTGASMSITPSSRGEWYRGLLERTSPPSLSPVLEAPVILDSDIVKSEERRWLDELLKRGEEAVKEVAKVKEVGRLVVGLEMDL